MQTRTLGRGTGKSQVRVQVALSQPAGYPCSCLHILMDMLGRVVSFNLAFKMTALLEEPKNHKQWLLKAGQFYDAALQMKKLQGGTNYLPPSPGPRRSNRDSMAMDVDRIYLTPTQQAEHIRNNKCFICHKVGCSTRNHPGTKKTTSPRTYLPHNVSSLGLKCTKGVMLQFLS